MPLNRRRKKFEGFLRPGSRYLVLEPGFQTTLEGTVIEEVEDDGEDSDGEDSDAEGEAVVVRQVLTVLDETELVDGVMTRVFEEREYEDGEIVEVSRNFYAICAETGDTFYFGEDVDDYEDGVIVGHEGAWRAGVDGAKPGIVMPGRILLGARYMQEIAPGIALDYGVVEAMGVPVQTPWKFFKKTIMVIEGNLLEPGSGSMKLFAKGIGVVVDEELMLIDVVKP